ncbi:MAG: TatD family hydrolase [Bacteroidales bacterium]
MPPLIDIHSHQSGEQAGSGIHIRSLSYPSEWSPDLGDRLLSVGFHPWDTGTVDFDPESFEKMATHPTVIAIGEAGLDRLRGASLETQASLFLQQAGIAEKLGKPVIIHCVRAWEELIRLRLNVAPTVAWIIHGFRGKSELAAQLLRHGFYLSFGPPLLDEGTALAETFARVPDNRLFLETDEGEAEIGAIYERASRIRQTSLEQLQAIIYANFATVFGNDVLSRLATTN